MIKVYVSRAINAYFFDGDVNEMFSSRVYREGWRCEKMLDRIFFWHNHHCRGAFLWERRKNVQKEKTKSVRGV